MVEMETMTLNDVRRDDVIPRVFNTTRAKDMCKEHKQFSNSRPEER